MITTPFLQKWALPPIYTEFVSYILLDLNYFFHVIFYKFINKYL